MSYMTLPGLAGKNFAKAYMMNVGPTVRRAHGFGGTRRRAYRTYGAYGYGSTRRRMFRPGFDRVGGGRYRPTYEPNVEWKNHDTIVTTTNTAQWAVPTTAGTGLLAAGIVQQAGSVSSRLSRKIMVKSLEISYILTFSPGATSIANDTFFYCLLLDTQANGGQPANTDIWSTTTCYQSLRNLDNTGRFRMLKYWEVRLAAGAGVTTAYAPQAKSFQRHVKFKKPIIIDYNGTTGAASEIRSNNLLLCYASTAALTVATGSTRLRYCDN